MSKLFKRTKILATVGPAVYTEEKITELIMAGVNGCRLNFSHGNYMERDQQIAWIRAAAAKKEAAEKAAAAQKAQEEAEWFSWIRHAPKSEVEEWCGSSLAYNNAYFSDQRPYEVFSISISRSVDPYYGSSCIFQVFIYGKNGEDWISGWRKCDYYYGSAEKVLKNFLGVSKVTALFQ